MKQPLFHSRKEDAKEERRSLGSFFFSLHLFLRPYSFSTCEIRSPPHHRADRKQTEPESRDRTIRAHQQHRGYGTRMGETHLLALTLAPEPHRGQVQKGASRLTGRAPEPSGTGPQAAGFAASHRDLTDKHNGAGGQAPDAREQLMPDCHKTLWDGQSHHSPVKVKPPCSAG